MPLSDALVPRCSSFLRKRSRYVDFCSSSSTSRNAAYNSRMCPVGFVVSTRLTWGLATRKHSAKTASGSAKLLTPRLDTIRSNSWSPNGRCAASASKICTLGNRRSEEHTSELQSHSDLVCRLLLEKKKKIDMNAKL